MANAGTPLITKEGSRNNFYTCYNEMRTENEEFIKIYLETKVIPPPVLTDPTLQQIQTVGDDLIKRVKEMSKDAHGMTYNPTLAECEIARYIERQILKQNPKFIFPVNDAVDW